MSWNSIVGQSRTKEILRRSVEQKRIAHAYLFWGPGGIGKDALAIEFAKTLLCETQSPEACDSCASCKKVQRLQHPDLKLIFALPASKADKPGENGEGKIVPDVREEIRRQLERKAANLYFRVEIPKATQINIGSIREVKRESALSAFEKGMKIFVILGAELMNDASANSLLKVLEEPLSDTVFLLTTARKEKLLSTIVSRCQSIRCEALSDPEIEAALLEREHVPKEQALLVSRLADGNYARALELLTDDVVARREEAVDFLRTTLAGSSVKLMEKIDERISENDRNEVEQFLMLLLTWVRDAMVMKEDRGEGIINEDQRENLARFVARFKNTNFPASLRAVERSLELLRGNVYLPLVMLSLSIQLKRAVVDAK